MLAAGACWRPRAPVVSVDEVMGRLEFAHYVKGWPKPGDLGEIAEEEGPIGAAWLRVFSEDDPGFGFVDAQTPELGMGVVTPHRGRGVGAELLGAVIADAADAGLPGISLSVERDNYAARLYERFGFRRVGEVGGSFTMLLRFEGSTHKSVGLTVARIRCESRRVSGVGPNGSSTGFGWRYSVPHANCNR